MDLQLINVWVLCYKPIGVLIETKVDIRRRAEGKASKLGI